MRFESEIENIRDLNPTAIRIPSELKEKIKQAAKENQQSMNAEIVRRLEKSFEEIEVDGLSEDAKSVLSWLRDDIALEFKRLMK